MVPVKIAALPPNEDARLQELHVLGILDTLPEQAYDDLTFLASKICDTPIALVSLVDAGRQWFKSRVGLGVAETSRDLAFCSHAILEPEGLLIVNDAAADDRFADNPLVLEDPSIRFYAGAPLVTSRGNALGTLCVIDREPREMPSADQAALLALSRQVVSLLELRVAVADLEIAVAEKERYHQRLEEYQRMLEDHVAQVAEQSITDPLTGLRNRRAFRDSLDDEVQRYRRYGTPLSLAVIDVDQFKVYNDRHGHSAGDDVLVGLSRLLRDLSRATDVVARYGGEEFAVILPNTAADGGHVIAERVRRGVAESEWELSDVTISIGVATMHDGIEDAAGLIDAADVAMYEAKGEGRNRVISAEAA